MSQRSTEIIQGLLYSSPWLIRQQIFNQVVTFYLFGPPQTTLHHFILVLGIFFIRSTEVRFASFLSGGTESKQGGVLISRIHKLRHDGM